MDNSFAKTSSKEGMSSRIDFIKKNEKSVDKISGNIVYHDPKNYKGNVENYIGMAQIPIGLTESVTVKGSHANGTFMIPMATTEGTLVASYSRGIKAMNLSGGVTTLLLAEGVARCPMFKFDRLMEAARFVEWVKQQKDMLSDIVESTSSFAKLKEITYNIEGNTVMMTINYSTGDAAGQNMVTICTAEICKYIIVNTPINPQSWYIECNYSADKKASYKSLLTTRGKKVSAEVIVSKEIVLKVLKSTPKQMVEHGKSSAYAGIQAGTIGIQAHVSNALTAIFIATGQDVACVAEASIGITRFDLTDKGDLYAALTLPNLIVGTVGGGTSLPTQNECLELMNCNGPGKSRQFAEICCAVALAGELSIIAALSNDHFTRAHQLFGRKSS